MRAQAPTAERRFKLPAGFAFSAIAFILTSLIIYWAGWKVASLVVPLVLVGIVGLPYLTRRFGGAAPDRFERRTLLWLVPYLVGLFAITWLGNYGGGLGVIPVGVDLALVVGLGIVVLMLSYRFRLPDEIARSRLAAALAGSAAEDEA